MSVRDICISRLNREDTPASSCSDWWGWQPRSSLVASLPNPTSHLENARWKRFCFHPSPAFVVSPVPEDSTYLRITPRGRTEQSLHPAAAFAPSLPRPLRCASLGETEARPATAQEAPKPSPLPRAPRGAACPGVSRSFRGGAGLVAPRLHPCAARRGSSVPRLAPGGGARRRRPEHPPAPGCARPVEAAAGRGALPAPAAPAATGFPPAPLSLSSFQSRQPADFPDNLKAQSCRAGGIKAGEMGQPGSHGEGGEAAPRAPLPAPQPSEPAAAALPAPPPQGLSGAGPPSAPLSPLRPLAPQPLRPVVTRSPPGSCRQNAVPRLRPAACAGAGGHPGGRLPPAGPEELQPVQVPVPRAPRAEGGEEDEGSVCEYQLATGGYGLAGDAEF